MIPRYTDVEQFFSVSSEDGMITTTRPLDREAQAWHNISVAAAEIGTNTPAYTHKCANVIIVNVCTMMYICSHPDIFHATQRWCICTLFNSICQLYRVVAAALVSGLVQ